MMCQCDRLGMLAIIDVLRSKRVMYVHEYLSTGTVLFAVEDLLVYSSTDTDCVC
jgi:hypothetical protein